MKFCRYILSILTSYVKKSNPELEEALLLVRSLRGTWYLLVILPSELLYMYSVNFNTVTQSIHLIEAIYELLNIYVHMQSYILCFHWC